MQWLAASAFLDTARPSSVSLDAGEAAKMMEFLSCKV